MNNESFLLVLLTDGTNDKSFRTWTFSSFFHPLRDPISSQRENERDNNSKRILQICHVKRNLPVKCIPSLVQHRSISLFALSCILK